MEKDMAARFLVEGRVQGVFYRATTREQALRLGLRGRACNLADGRVEVVVAGRRPAVDALERWLWVGPPLARVVGVSRLVADPGAVDAGFVTG